MEEDKKSSTDPVNVDDNEEREAIEIALFQVPECYVYLIPPRKTAASYRFFLTFMIETVILIYVVRRFLQNPFSR
jgi:hypothetical protein